MMSFFFFSWNVILYVSGFLNIVSLIFIFYFYENLCDKILLSESNNNLKGLQFS